MPLARGEKEADSPAVISEYMGEGSIAPMVMIRHGRYKYIHCPADPPQLFDLANDPDELENLAANPDHAELKAQFEKRVREHADLETVDRRVRESQKRRRVVFEAHMAGIRTSWDYHPPCHAANQYMRNHLDLNDVESRARLVCK